MSKKVSKKERENNKILGIILIVLFILVVVLVFKPKSNKISSDLIEINGSYDLDEGYVFTNYEDFKNHISNVGISRKDFTKYNYIYFPLTYDDCYEKDVRIKDYKIENNEIVVNVTYEELCDDCFNVHNIEKHYLLKIDKKYFNYEFRLEYYNTSNERCRRYTLYKPLIYLYPEKEMKISVELGYPNKLTTTYPEYNKKWEVIAKPNGELKDSTGRTYYGLYWEGETTNKPKLDEGFVVSKKDTVKFLEEKLAILGLTEREANEFIIYWLPRLNKNKYNLIRFETIDEINKDMPLKVSPKPDTVIRVFMDFKPLDKKIEIKEQKLTKQTRKGFTIVEWGGSLIK